MNTTRNGLYGTALVWAAIGLAGCANSMTSTGVPGVKMGDSYGTMPSLITRTRAVSVAGGAV